MKGSVKQKKPRVFVGLSGGVDSAVTAALLQREGYDVVGVFIKGWYPPGMHCTWAEDRREAMRVAAHLGIVFTTLDASSEYKRGVIEYLLSEYKAGRTPNPDIMCNKEVKFGAFHRFAKAHHADFLATGHYARTQEGALLRGVDEAKDQSYFLWAVPKEVLREVLFPLGGLVKNKTRTYAREFSLPNAARRDSQGICFLGSVSVDEFLRAEFGEAPGEAYDEHGKRIGVHRGVLLYTPGARVVLTGAAQGPWYVLSKDVEHNTLIVSRERTQAIPSAALTLRDMNFIGMEDKDQLCTAQLRYHGPVVQGSYTSATRTFTPATTLPEPAAPGQSLVLYDNDTVLAGGILV